jgi:hypothetical protein
MCELPPTPTTQPHSPPATSYLQHTVSPPVNRTNISELMIVPLVGIVINYLSLMLSAVATRTHIRSLCTSAVPVQFPINFTDTEVIHG